MTLEVRKTSVVDVRPPLRERAKVHYLQVRGRAVVVTRRHAWTAWRIVRQLPRTALLLVGYAPRGIGRATAAWARYLRDYDTAELRTQHAGAKETDAYVKISQVRSANLTARIMVNATALLALAVPLLAWNAPTALGALLGALVFVWVIKLIPGRGWNEVIIALVLAGIVFFTAPKLAGYVPRPPEWAWWLAGAVAVSVLGWVGRPKAKPLVTIGDTAMGGYAPPLTAPMVTAALCTLGNSKMKEPDDIRLLSDPVRCGEGYQLDVELPTSVTAAFVVGNREPFAAALRRELGCVFLSVGRRHPAHLVVFVSDQPMSQQEQAPWPLRKGTKVDIFTALPLVTNQRGEWVKVTFAYASMVIGAVPRMGKTFLLRVAMLACALDPRVRIIALDGKGTGDLACFEPIAEFYSRGVNPEKIELVREMIRGLRAELQKRADFLDSLPESECPENKVTSELASRYPRQLAPIVIGVDETQMYFDYGEKKNKEHARIRDELSAGFTELVKLGPALGIIVFLATQNVNTTTVPRGISTNVVIRAALKVSDQISNDQILGTGAYKRGIDATQLDFTDKGVLILAADGGRPEIVRSVAGMDAAAAKKLAALAAALRRAEGTLPADDDEQAVLVADLVADVRAVLAERSRPAAQHVEIATWLAERWPEQYADLTVDELSARLRSRGVAISQVWANGRNAMGVDLRKQENGR